MEDWGEAWRGVGEEVRAKVGEMQHRVQTLAKENDALHAVVEEETNSEREQKQDLDRLREELTDLRDGNDRLQREKTRLERDVHTAEDEFEQAVSSVDAEEAALKNLLLVAKHKLAQLRLLHTNLKRTSEAYTDSAVANIQAVQSCLTEKKAYLAHLHESLSSEISAFSKEITHVPAPVASLVTYLDRL